jgi:hypothetical protein
MLNRLPVRAIRASDFELLSDFGDRISVLPACIAIPPCAKKNPDGRA